VNRKRWKLFSWRRLFSWRGLGFWPRAEKELAEHVKRRLDVVVDGFLALLDDERDLTFATRRHRRKNN
jgi:hypothetical protein